MGSSGIACLHRSDVWRMGKNFFMMDGMCGNAGLKVTTNGILSVCVLSVLVLCRAVSLCVCLAFVMAD